MDKRFKGALINEFVMLASLKLVFIGANCPGRGSVAWRQLSLCPNITIYDERRVESAMTSPAKLKLLILHAEFVAVVGV